MTVLSTQNALPPKYVKPTSEKTSSKHLYVMDNSFMEQLMDEIVEASEISEQSYRAKVGCEKRQNQMVPNSRNVLSKVQSENQTPVKLLLPNVKLNLQPAKGNSPTNLSHSMSKLSPRHKLDQSQTMGGKLNNSSASLFPRSKSKNKTITGKMLNFTFNKKAESGNFHQMSLPHYNKLYVSIKSQLKQGLTRNQAQTTKVHNSLNFTGGFDSLCTLENIQERNASREKVKEIMQTQNKNMRKLKATMTLNKRKNKLEAIKYQQLLKKSLMKDPKRALIIEEYHSKTFNHYSSYKKVMGMFKAKCLKLALNSYKNLNNRKSQKSTSPEKFRRGSYMTLKIDKRFSTMMRQKEQVVEDLNQDKENPIMNTNMVHSTSLNQMNIERNAKKPTHAPKGVLNQFVGKEESQKMHNLSPVSRNMMKCYNSALRMSRNMDCKRSYLSFQGSPKPCISTDKVKVKSKKAKKKRTRKQKVMKILEFIPQSKVRESLKDLLENQRRRGNVKRFESFNKEESYDDYTDTDIQLKVTKEESGIPTGKRRSTKTPIIKLTKINIKKGLGGGDKFAVNSKFGKIN